jgi:Short C-terminal domain
LEALLRSQTVRDTLLSRLPDPSKLQLESCMRLISACEWARHTKSLLRAPLVALVCAVIFACTGLAYADTVYVDSRQHFTIDVPDGWFAKPYNAGGASGVTIVHGADAYVQIFLQKGIDPASFLKALNNEIQTTHPGYRVSNRGVRTMAGQPRMFIVGESAETPSSPRMRVYLETFAANGFSYAIIASSSANHSSSPDSMADYKVSQQMIQSLTLNGVPARTLMASEGVPGTASLPTATDAGATGGNSAALSARDRKKLAALDAAWKGGALSQEEYQTKKDALYSSDLHQRNYSAVRKAVDQAYADGVLTKDEYERKKKDLEVGVPALAASANPIPDPEPPALKPVEERVPKSGPQPEPLPKSWTTHSDPAGFVVNLPAAWTVDKVSSNGQVVLHGTRGEEIVIWPLHLQQSDLDAQGAATMVQELARKFDALMPWSSVQTMPNASRVMGLGAERSATAVLSWANGPGAASVCFYAIEAPGEVYHDSTDSFAAILKSFHVVQISSAADAAKAANGSDAGELNFVDWSDPHESAFRVSVPEGWRVVGGGYRLSPVDARYSVVMVSPDGLVRASMGDSMVGAFTQPTQSLAAAGLGEGAFQTLDDGTRIEILGYNSGQQFAQSYVRTLLSRQCSDPQINSTRAREDLASAFRQSAANEGLANALLAAGEVSFTCNLGGRRLKGKYIAATIRMAAGASALWFVYRLNGYVAFAGR